MGIAAVSLDLLHGPQVSNKWRKALRQQWQPSERRGQKGLPGPSHLA